MKKIPHTILICSILAFSLPAKETSIPESANWLIKLDGAAFHKTRMGKFIMGKMNEAPNIKQKMDGLKNAFGVDLLKIRAISAYGSGEKEKGTAFLDGGIRSQQLEGFASLNDKVDIDKVGKVKTYTFNKGSLGILSEESVVIASNKELLVEGLDTKDRNKRNPLVSFVQSINKDQTPIVSFAANMLKVNRLQNKIKADQTTTAKKLAEDISKSLNSALAGEIIFKKFKNMAIFLDETQEHIRVQVYFQSANNEAATHLENIFRSWPSILALANGVNPKLDELMEHIKFSVVSENRNVGMTALLTHAFFETKIEEEIAKKTKKTKILIQEGSK
ncbi:MAG: hypothetical protein VXZ32_02460 [Verrucomicrobiota bacterium]|nr:hypothetical protein [Verrucomicrobiota bacterium]